MNRKRKSIACFLITFIFIFGVMGCQETHQKSDSKKEEIRANDAALDTFFSKLHAQKMFNGAVAVKKKGELIFKKGYGTENFDLETPFLASTQMEVASVSKQFTAAAVLILQQDGKLNVEDKVSDYLGEDFPYDQMTVKHLLTHTSGLPDYEKYFRKEWDSTEIVYNKDIVRYFKEIKPELMSVPGEKYHYSNSGYVLLAAIVKAVSGKELDDFLEERIFKVAGMENAGFYDRDDIWKMEGYAPGYMMDLRTCSYVKPDFLPGKYYYRFLSGRFGSGRLSLSIDDLIKWDRILYTDTVLNARSKKWAFTPHPPSKDTSDYGFGWHIPEKDSLKVVYHTGSWAGNLSYIKRFLDTQSLIVMGNNTYSPYLKEIRASVDAYVRDGKELEIPRPKAEILLARAICTLDESQISDWKQAHQDADWNKERLEKLEKSYEELKDKEKAKLVRKLIESFN